RTGEKRQEVHKMADFSQNPAATLLRIIDPMIRRKRAGVDSIVQDERPSGVVEKLLHPPSHRREAAIEANHQVTARKRIGILYLFQLSLIQAKRLFAKNVLSGFQRANYLARVQLMTAGNHSSVD